MSYYGASRDLRPLIDRARASGWRVEPSRGGHLIWLPPGGRDRVVSGKTLSDRRAVLNVRARLRRCGLEC